MKENNLQFPAENAHWAESGAQNAVDMQHDIAEEQRIIAKGKVELMLMALLNAGRISEVLHGANKGDFFRTIQFKIVTKQHKRLLSDSNNIKCWIKSRQQDFQNLLNLSTNITKTMPDIVNITAIETDTGFPVPYNESQQPSRIEQVIFGLQEQLRHLENISSSLYKWGVYYPFGKIFFNNDGGKECLECPWFTEILAGTGSCTNAQCPDYKNLPVYLSQPQMPRIIDLFVMQEGLLPEDAVQKLMKEFGIKLDEPFTALPITDSDNVNQIRNIHGMPPSNNAIGRFIPFHGSANTVLGFAAVNQTVENKRLMFPVTAWSFSGSTEEFFFPVPFERPYPLLNWNLIVQNPDAEIFLSESIELADVNTNIYQYSEIIWTAWLGGKETAADVNWEILRNRKVTIVIHNNSKDIVESALAAYFSLKSIAGVTIEFQNK